MLPISGILSNIYEKTNDPRQMYEKTQDMEQGRHFSAFKAREIWPGAATAPPRNTGMALVDLCVDYAWFDWAIADSLIADIYRDSINCHSRIRFIGGTDSIYKVCKGISPQNMDSTSILGSWNSH